MLVKNLLAIFTLTGLAVAYPTEDFEVRDVLEERNGGGGCPPGNTLCCSIVLGKNIGVFCKKANQWGQCSSGSPLCCTKGIKVDVFGNEICVQ